MAQPIPACHLLGGFRRRSRRLGRAGKARAHACDKRIALCLASHGTNQRQARPLVVGLGTEHQRRPPPRLLTPCVGIKSQPDEIAGAGTCRDIGGCHHDSWPAGGPQSVSDCRFFVVIRDTSCRSSYFRRAGRKTMLPSVARSSVRRSPSARRASLAKATGIRTARPFPHLETCVSLGIRICNEMRWWLLITAIAAVVARAEGFSVPSQLYIVSVFLSPDVSAFHYRVVDVKPEGRTPLSVTRESRRLI